MGNLLHNDKNTVVNVFFSYVNINHWNKCTVYIKHNCSRFLDIELTEQSSSRFPNKTSGSAYIRKPST